jgi:hypothetical protein
MSREGQALIAALSRELGINAKTMKFKPVNSHYE